MKEKFIKMLMVEPGKAPVVTYVGNSLDTLQNAVSVGADSQSLIEIITLEPGVCGQYPHTWIHSAAPCIIANTD